MLQIPKIIVTGGAGFIGSAVCRHLVSDKLAEVINLDALTYAANLSSLKTIEKDPLYSFKQTDICDAEAIHELIAETKPDGIIHLAAESHVDRSIDHSAEFIQTNVIGTYNLLEGAKQYWFNLSQERKDRFKFLHVSTDDHPLLIQHQKLHQTTLLQLGTAPTDYQL